MPWRPSTPPQVPTDSRSGHCFGHNPDNPALQRSRPGAFKCDPSGPRAPSREAVPLTGAGRRSDPARFVAARAGRAERGAAVLNVSWGHRGERSEPPLNYAKRLLTALLTAAAERRLCFAKPSAVPCGRMVAARRRCPGPPLPAWMRSSPPRRCGRPHGTARRSPSRRAIRARFVQRLRSSAPAGQRARRSSLRAPRGRWRRRPHPGERSSAGAFAASRAALVPRGSRTPRCTSA